MRSTRLRVMLVCMATATLAACGEGDSGSASTTTERRVTTTVAATTTTTAAPAATTLPDTGWIVAEVVDGDTLDVSGPPGVRRVRLIGIDAAEPGACFAESATNALNFLAPPGTPITLVGDTSDTDEYDRLLRYAEVTLTDGAFLDLGAELVVQGFVVAREYPPDTARAENYAARELLARASGAGMWAPNACPVGASPSTAP